MLVTDCFNLNIGRELLVFTSDACTHSSPPYCATSWIPPCFASDELPVLAPSCDAVACLLALVLDIGIQLNLGLLIIELSANAARPQRCRMVLSQSNIMTWKHISSSQL